MYSYPFMVRAIQCYRYSVKCSIIIQSIVFSRLIRARMHYICTIWIHSDQTMHKSCIYVPRSKNVPRSSIPPYNVPGYVIDKTPRRPFINDVPRYTYFCLRVRYIHVPRSYPGTRTLERKLAKKGPKTSKDRCIDRPPW